MLAERWGKIDPRFDLDLSGSMAVDAEGQWWGVITMMSLFQMRVPVEMAEVVVRRVAA